MELEFHPYGTGVSSLRDWSFIPTGLESLPQEIRIARLRGTSAGVLSS